MVKISYWFCWFFVKDAGSDFKEFIRLSGMTQVRTSPHYPQSNGKIERWHQSLKRECLRPRTPLSLEEARRLVGEGVDHCNHVRLHSAIGHVAPMDKLLRSEVEIFAERERKQRREQARLEPGSGVDTQAVALVS